MANRNERKGKAMELFISLLFIVDQLRPAFARQATFQWFVVAIMGFCMREDSMGGVSSFVRTLSLNPKFYQRLLNFFQTNSIDLEHLTQIWVSVVFKIFKAPLVTFNGHPILVIDGINVPKEGKKMPGIQSLHQSSESNSKPKFIMGHSFQSVGLLAGSPLSTIFCIPLFARIHLGTKTTNRDKTTLYDKAISMLEFIPKTTTFYLVADAYYSTRKMLLGATQRGSHIISRVKSNAVAYFPAESKSNQQRGRPKKYGKKIKLRKLFNDLTHFVEMDSPSYGEKGVKIMV